MIFLAALSFSSFLFPQHRAGKGQGGIVTRDDAPVYKARIGDEVEYRLKRGDAVAGITGGLALPTTWMFEERDGRVKVCYLMEGRKTNGDGWMLMSDLSVFAFDGSCSQTGGPFAARLKAIWNPCFQEGRDAKLEELHKKWAEEEAAKGSSMAPSKKEPTPGKPGDPNQTP